MADNPNQTQLLISEEGFIASETSAYSSFPNELKRRNFTLGGIIKLRLLAGNQIAAGNLEHPGNPTSGVRSLIKHLTPQI
jgi:hypothetical protein